MSKNPKQSSMTKRVSPSPSSPVASMQPTQAMMLQMLQDMQQKLNTSPALNGAFETMLYKVDKIEEANGKIVETVDAIHQAIYEPDNGLFARIAAMKTTHVEDMAEFDKKVVHLAAWKDHVEEHVSEDKVVHENWQNKQDDIQKQVNDAHKQIETIERWKGTTSNMMKWAMTTIGGGTVALLGKLAYDFFTVHWK